MIPGLTRGAFKTLIMLSAGIFLLVEISNELRVSSKKGEPINRLFKDCKHFKGFYS
jgi:hypothetical protein